MSKKVYSKPTITVAIMTPLPSSLRSLDPNMKATHTWRLRRTSPMSSQTKMAFPFGKPSSPYTISPQIAQG